MIGLLPNHRERQFMQYLRGAGWIRAGVLPDWPRVIEQLLTRGWIEQQVESADVSYRITEKGLEAKKLPVRVGRAKVKGNDQEF